MSRRKSLPDRFWAKVDKLGPSDCWIWKGSKRNGYGLFRVGLHTFQAHRIAYELVVGPIPASLYACHHCDTPACCNPAHLFLGTAKDNTRDAMAKGRFPPCMPAERKSRGSHHCNAKLNNDKVRAIRERVKRESKSSLAREFGVTAPTIHDVVTRQTWKHIK